MKNTRLLLLLILFVFVSTINVNAQRYKYAISGSFGYIQDGLSGMVGFDYRLNDKSYIELNMQYNSSTLAYRQAEVPLVAYGTNLGYYFILSNSTRRYARYGIKNMFNNGVIAVGGGASVGSETINDGESVIDENTEFNVETSQVIYGGFVAFEANLFFSKSTALHFKVAETYHANSNFGDLFLYAGIGLKYTIQ